MLMKLVQKSFPWNHTNVIFFLTLCCQQYQQVGHTNVSDGRQALGCEENETLNCDTFP